MLVNIKENQNVIFKGVETRTSRKNNVAFQMVVLADMDNVEKFEFFKRDNLVIDGLSVGDKVKAVIELSRRGFNTNVDLVELNAAK